MYVCYTALQHMRFYTTRVQIKKKVKEKEWTFKLNRRTILFKYIYLHFILPTVR